MKRNVKIHLTLTSKEKELLIRRSRETGLPLSSYCRFVLINSKPKLLEEDSDG